jgi:hypothetical protein
MEHPFDMIANGARFQSSVTADAVDAAQTPIGNDIRAIENLERAGV